MSTTTEDKKVIYWHATAVAGLKIDVDTNAGMVTLTGTVATKAEADRAVALARDTNGVKSVVNKLRIGR